MSFRNYLHSIPKQGLNVDQELKLSAEHFLFEQQNEDPDAPSPSLERLVLHNLRWVVAACSAEVNMDNSLSELVMEANMTLINCAAKFYKESKKGQSLKDYAYRYVLETIKEVKK